MHTGVVQVAYKILHTRGDVCTFTTIYVFITRGACNVYTLRIQTFILLNVHHTRYVLACRKGVLR
mgnify:CR=1 FL=1